MEPLNTSGLNYEELLEALKLIRSLRRAGNEEGATLLHRICWPHLYGPEGRNIVE